MFRDVIISCAVMLDEDVIDGMLEDFFDTGTDELNDWGEGAEGG